MNVNFTRVSLLAVSVALLFCCDTSLGAQNAQERSLPVVSGTICDSDDRPLAGAEVRLTASDESKPRMAATDAQGHFRFDGVPPGTYALEANREGYRRGSEGPFVLHATETKSVILRLAKTKPGADISSAMPFSDEPQFTVAGVTDTTALGVHSSSRTMPNSSALTKDTVALSHEQPATELATSSQEAAIRSKLAAGDSAVLRFQLAEIEEREGHALEAEKDYQRAAGMAPTEVHLFAWGAELLLHRAFEPAIEVFRKGNRLYPGSVRMLLGLGATYYAQGSRDEAAQFFLRASDVNPSNPQPYLFLGRLLLTENLAPQPWTDATKRFVTLHPETAEAHYLYGLALSKQPDEPSANAAQAQLEKAIELDPRLGNAYLQLGILKSSRKDFTGAIVALQKAIEFTPLPDEAHYRLAEVYRRTGDAEKARQQTALYKQISEQKSQEVERERHEIQQFIYTLTGVPPTQTPASPPH